MAPGRHICLSNPNTAAAVWMSYNRKRVECNCSRRATPPGTARRRPTKLPQRRANPSSFRRWIPKLWALARQVAVAIIGHAAIGAGYVVELAAKLQQAAYHCRDLTAAAHAPLDLTQGRDRSVDEGPAGQMFEVVGHYCLRLSRTVL